jgi:hypothetical protein
MEVCVHFLTCFSFSNAQILYCCYSRKLNSYLYYTCGLLPPHRNIYAHNNPPNMYSVTQNIASEVHLHLAGTGTSNFHATKGHHSIHKIPLQNYPVPVESGPHFHVQFMI